MMGGWVDAEAGGCVDVCFLFFLFFLFFFSSSSQVLFWFAPLLARNLSE